MTLSGGSRRYRLLSAAKPEALVFGCFSQANTTALHQHGPAQESSLKHVRQFNGWNTTWLGQNSWQLKLCRYFAAFLLSRRRFKQSSIVVHEDTKHGSIAILAVSNMKDDSTDHGTHAAVDAKISALRALVSKPTTAAKRQVKSTIIPMRKLAFLGSMLTKHTIAPMSNTALRKIETTAPAR